MKIYISTNVPIGVRCGEWAKANLPAGITLSTIEECDIFFSIFYNKLITQEFIDKRKKCFNFHGGILPEYRGSGTLNWAILNGEKESGITLHEIDHRIDHGPIIEMRKFPILETDTTEDLFVKAENTIFQMFQDWFARLVAIDYPSEPQNDNKAHLYTRKDLQDAKDLTRFARAFHTPGFEQAYYYNKKGEKIYLQW